MPQRVLTALPVYNEVAHMGEEEKILRLAEAVKVVSYEVRGCPDCGGDGSVRVYGYPRPKKRRGR